MDMNRYEIEERVDQYQDHEILGPATRTLENLMRWTDSHSDGWPYWAKPSRAAKQLTTLIKGGRMSRFDDEREDVTAAAYKKALIPIKAFRTREGADFYIEELGAGPADDVGQLPPSQDPMVLRVVGHVIRLHPDPDCPDELAAKITGTPWCYDIDAPESDVPDLGISSCTGWDGEEAAREAAMDDLRDVLGVSGARPSRPRPIIGEPHLVASEEGHLFEPWTDGWAVGFRVTHGTTGQVAYVYLNPSSSDDPSAFLYVGPDGDPAADDSVVYVDLFKDWVSDRRKPKRREPMWPGR